MNKREQVEQIYLKNKSESDRDVLVDKVMKSVDVTKGTARTYLSLAIKKHAIANGKDYVERNINRASLKREQARKIFINNPTKTRKDLVDMMVEELDMTRQSASTHCTIFSKSMLKQGITNHNALSSMRQRK